MERILIFIVLIFFIFTATDIVYTNVKADDAFLEDASDYYMVDQRLTEGNGNTLIPKGAIQGVNDVYYVEFQYEIILKEGKELESSIEQLWISNSVSQEMLEEIFNFEFEYEEVNTLDYREHLFRESVSASVVIVTLRVSMNEPATYEVFQQLIGRDLSFKVYFSTN